MVFKCVGLPENHMPFYFTSYPDEAKKCLHDISCPYKNYLNTRKCWGYENNCTKEEHFSYPECDEYEHLDSKLERADTFYNQADFGYVKKQREEMKLICEPHSADDSLLECTNHLRFCRGRNLLIDFTSLIEQNEPLRYNMNVLKEGNIGGYCTFYKSRLDKETDHISALQSWGPELRYFSKLNRKPTVSGDCDVIIRKPTFIMKIDATINMYHHFCDFFNLYVSLHVNSTHPSAFSTDVNILIWETYTYHSAFKETWEAFTEHLLLDLKSFRGKKVCFNNIVFPLLPRMIFGLYYNTPIIYGCKNSGLFRAFSQHILHRLKIPLYERNKRRLRVTFLSRDTQFRRILNEMDLMEALQKNKNYFVKQVIFNKNINFKKQLEISRNTDILIGMHGAGLTHMLFLPEWAAVFEVYNCEDVNCYKDLARLCGLKYITWENINKLKQQDKGSHPDGGAHAKFTNYSFDVDEFQRLLEKLEHYVKNHRAFKEMIEKMNNRVHIEL